MSAAEQLDIAFPLVYPVLFGMGLAWTLSILSTGIKLLAEILTGSRDTTAV